MSRSLSYKGVKFSTLEHKLDEEQREVYNRAARIWQQLWKKLEQAMEACDVQRRVVMSQFWGRHQNFFRQVCKKIYLHTTQHPANRRHEARIWQQLWKKHKQAI